MKALNLLKLCLLAGLLMAGPAGCDKQTETKATIQGRWSGFENGRPEQITLQFKDDRFTYWDAQSNELGGGTFLVTDTRQPAHLDMTFQTCPAPEYIGKVSLAIYELQGSELKIAGAEPGIEQRPTNIASGQGIRTFTFKRE